MLFTEVSLFKFDQRKTSRQLLAAQELVEKFNTCILLDILHSLICNALCFEMSMNPGQCKTPYSSDFTE